MASAQGHYNELDCKIFRSNNKEGESEIIKLSTAVFSNFDCYKNS